MATCESWRLRVILHLDDELDAGERRLVESHLKTCAACRGAFNRERLFREGIRRRRPLHVVPDDLRARVAMLVDAGRAVSPAPGIPRRVRTSPSGAARRLRAYAVAVLIAGLVGLVGVRNVSDVVVASAEAASFPGMAVDVHKRHQRGQLPLELTTDAAGDISRWFEGKVPFGVTLPDYQESSGQENRYEIRGARLVGFNGDYAAYVAYRDGSAAHQSRHHVDFGRQARGRGHHFRARHRVPLRDDRRPQGRHLVAPEPYLRPGIEPEGARSAILHGLSPGRRG